MAYKKKVYSKPCLQVEVFEPQQYVAVCSQNVTYTFTCDAKGYCYSNSNGTKSSFEYQTDNCQKTFQVEKSKMYSYSDRKWYLFKDGGNETKGSEFLGPVYKIEFLNGHTETHFSLSEPQEHFNVS